MFEIKMPKMGESVEQGTITRWFVSKGDMVEEDDVLLEIATDKVDSEIPSPVAGRVEEILFEQDSVVAVGEVIARINTEPDSKKDEDSSKETKSEPKDEKAEADSPESEEKAKKDDKKDDNDDNDKNDSEAPTPPSSKESSRFYSPLVRSIAKNEDVSTKELDSIEGSGMGGRVNKDDILSYIESRDPKTKETTQTSAKTDEGKSAAKPSMDASDTIVEMGRTRKLIAQHMIHSKDVSAHVTNMLEADVTELVQWRTRMKETYENKYKVKLTFMPIFTEAAARALRDFPMVNSSVDGENIIVKNKINIGIAVARPDGNLVVPVVSDADKLNIPGLADSINSLAADARENKLPPDKFQGGTFSITNFGTFRNLMGTPIIAQPQVAILATGSIEKKPAVVETEHGDIIVPRHKMFLSLSYDHRIIDGSLGGAFLRRVADYLEEFDTKREV